MGTQYAELRAEDKTFISAQHVFFVATATRDSSINLSPKGLDSLRIIDDAHLVWLNLTGSGNETAAHLQHDGRITLMFCSFDPKPLILRVYGRGEIIHTRHENWEHHAARFRDVRGARQIVDCHIERVQRSCGFGVPLMRFDGDRPLMHDWIERQGDDGIQTYWNERNRTSIDGLPTFITADESDDR